ncbi:MAG TPA: glycosyltransferase family 2 protein [Agriterribacter sp.]|nr:glycosyltransferase family 2 protein [Agriterribacter sp.]
MLSVIIVNYNVKYFLEQCLSSVQKAGKHLPVEVIVVDNCSADGSCEYLEPLFPEVIFCRNKENLGFAKACNLGWKRAKGNYVLFLNPDTIVGEDCFEQCIEFLRMHSNAGALGVRMVDETGRFLKESKRGFPSPRISFFKLSGLAALFPQSPLFAKYYLGNLSEFTVHEADVIAGAFMMMRKSVLDTTGGFDEAFFMYGEDIDLSYRIQKMGLKNYYFPEVTLLHFKGRSTPQKDLRYVKVFYGAMNIFIAKHFGQQRWGVLQIILKAAIQFRAILALGQYGVSSLISKIKQRFSGWGKYRPSSLILVIGSLGDYTRVLSLTNSVTQKNSLHYEPERGQRNAGKNAVNIKELLKTHQVHYILFCEGGLSFNEIIGTIEQLNDRLVKIGIHASGSTGILWSEPPA